MYKEIWNPALSEILFLVREADNEKDKFAVAVRKTVVLVPYIVEVPNKATVEVTAAAINPGAGYS